MIGIKASQRFGALAKLAILIGGLPLLVSSPGCNSTPEFPPQWSAGAISVPSERILWEVTVMALEKHAFPVGSNIDPVSLDAVTGWRNHLGPFRGQGYRERAHVKYSHVGGGSYEVEVRIEHEINMDIVRPLDARYAEWKPAADDVEEANVLLQRIKSYVGGDFELTTEDPLPWEE